MSRDLLALFAKCPRPGEVKTRLVPELGATDAAALYEAMLLDIVEQHSNPPADRDLALWFSPEDAEPWFRSNVPPAYRLLAQEGSDLPKRMRALFERHSAEGYTRIVLRGTDSPTLPGARIDGAFATLSDSDLVLCPDLDGGYNLIGLCAPCDDIFDISMSTASVLDETVARAEAAGLRVRLLDPHHDVDVPADLALLRAGLDPVCAPRTARWLAARPAPMRRE